MGDAPDCKFLTVSGRSIAAHSRGELFGEDHKSKHGRGMAANENVAQSNDANQNGGVQQQQLVLGICLKSLNSEINRLGSNYFENGQVVLPNYLKTRIQAFKSLAQRLVWAVGISKPTEWKRYLK